MDTLGLSRLVFITLVLASPPVMGAELRPFRLPETTAPPVYQPPPDYRSQAPLQDRREAEPPPRRSSKPRDPRRDDDWRERFEYKNNEVDQLLRDLQ